MKTRSIFPLMTLALLCFAIRASAIPISNIVNNGGFENGSLPPWKTSGGGSSSRAAASAIFGVDHDSAHTGGWGAFAAPHGSLGYLSQTLETQRGSVYELSFWLSASQSGAASATAGHPMDFKIFWNGSLVFEQTSAFPSDYAHYDFILPAATSDRTNLKFGFRNDSGEFHLDDVIVGIPSIPEAFSTLWLALPLVLLVGAARLRDRKKLDFALN